MKLTAYTVYTNVPRPLRVIVASDLHDRPADRALSQISKAKPDFILCPGDMIQGLHTEPAAGKNGFLFMKSAAEIAPLYYSLGNHELGASVENSRLLRESGICLLDDSYASPESRIFIGGLTSGYVRSMREHGKYAPLEPNLSFIKEFSSLDGFKLLLCHHPEYYKSHLKETSVQMTVSGHAHGGQWRIFNRGAIAPGQGLFPKYCRGVHEDRLCISCGMANTVAIPRFFNPRELVLLHLIPIWQKKTVQKS